MTGKERAERERTWGARCIERREVLKLSQAQVADIAQLTQQTVSKVENNEILARYSTMQAMAAALGTSVEVLFPFGSFDATKRANDEARHRARTAKKVASA